MKFPKWAPEILVELYFSRLKDSEYSSSTSPEKQIKASNAVNPSEKKEYERALRHLYQHQVILGSIEGISILKKLLTDDRMKEAWISISKRIKYDYQYLQLLCKCEAFIIEWRGRLKISETDRKKHLDKIIDTANHLDSLLSDTYEFSLEDTSFLTDIPKSAKQYKESHAGINEPNLQKAESIFFQKKLSEYTRKAVKQPLHNTVAIITSVILDADVDCEQVRKNTRHLT